MVNWEINIYDLAGILGVGFLLYGRLISVETKLAPLWDEYNRKRQARAGG